jgi:D-sedoheptulose 7-phosphate isomerase
MTSFTEIFLSETQQILDALDADGVETLARDLAAVRDRGGRLFVLGVGGSAGHASHAVNDFRKLCGPELTARTNDEGWDSVFSAWLEASRLSPDDAVLVLSVGGGDVEHNVSPNIVRAIELAQKVGASVHGIVGRDGGYTAATATSCVVIPPLVGERVTPHTEGLCAVVWHLLVSHPVLQRDATKWESVVGDAS